MEQEQEWTPANGTQARTNVRNRNKHKPTPGRRTGARTNTRKQKTNNDQDQE